MFGRKNKQPEEQGSGRRQLKQQGGAPGPAFSYYANRSSPASRERNRADVGKPKEPVRPNREAARLLPLVRRAQLPVWLLIAVVLICAVKVLWLSTNPKVILFGKNTTTATYVQADTVYAAVAGKALGSSITGHTKLTADLNGTAQTIEHQFPELQTVSIGMPLIGNRPVVYAQIAQPSLILQTTHGNFALNSSGLVLAHLQAQPAGIPIVFDQSGVPLKTGDHYLPHSSVAFIQTIAYQLSAAHQTVSSFTLPQGSPYEVDVHISGQSFTIRCNLQADALQQSGAALATLQHLGNSLPASYLDVRVPGRVYYK